MKRKLRASHTDTIQEMEQKQRKELRSRSEVLGEEEVGDRLVRKERIVVCEREPRARSAWAAGEKEELRERRRTEVDSVTVGRHDERRKVGGGDGRVGERGRVELGFVGAERGDVAVASACRKICSHKEVSAWMRKGPVTEKKPRV